MQRHLARRARLLSAVWLAVAAFEAIAQTDPYPAKPIRVVVPFSAGGAVDIVARALGERLSTQTGQSVIVDNRPGASANLGAEAVAKSAPDGYTLLVGANGLATNMSLFAKPPFNTIRDLKPISLIGNAPLVLVVPIESKITSVQQLIATGRADKDALTYGSAGNGSSGHLAGALLASVGRFEALHVPYKGGTPAMVDLIGGRLSFMLLNPLEVLSQVRSGKLRAVAVTGTKRIPLLPDVPTVAEAGLPGLEAGVWWALMAPAGTPASVVAKLNLETNRALADATVRERLESLGAVVTPGTSEQLGAFLQSEIDKWGKVIRTANIQVE